MKLANYDKMTSPKTFVPEHDRDGIHRYIENGILPGSFLQAVICNDLLASVALADLENTYFLTKIVAWFYTYAPALCWGSQERMQAWSEYRQVQRKQETQA